MYDLADQSGLPRLHACLVALLAAMQNRPRQAVETATEGLTRPGWLPASFEIVGVLALTLGCGELGRLDDIDRHIERAYDLARTAVAAPQARFDLAVAHINALVLGDDSPRPRAWPIGWPPSRWSSRGHAHTGPC